MWRLISPSNISLSYQDVSFRFYLMLFLVTQNLIQNLIQTNLY